MEQGTKANRKLNTASLASDILTTKCPCCRSHNLFEHSTYSRKFLTMYDTCPNCGQDFRQEPGFYFGAMYFSYAINIAVMVICGVGFELIFDPVKIWPTILSVLLPPILLAPYTYRLARTINLYVFGRYKNC